MALLVVRLQVTDFGVWKKAFDEVEDVRREYGWEKHGVYKDPANPNAVVVVGQVHGLDRARGYLADDRVKAVVAKSGLQAPPEAWFLSEVESKTYTD